MSNTTTDPTIAPAYVLNTLRAAGYEPYSVDDGPDQWRIPGHPPTSWRQAMEEIGTRFVALKDENQALVAQNAKLAAVTPRSGFLSSEFVLSVLTAIPMVGGAVFVVLQDSAEELFPAPWGKVVAGVAAVLAAMLAKNYTGARTSIKAQAGEEKKALVSQEEKKS